MVRTSTRLRIGAAALALASFGTVDAARASGTELPDPSVVAGGTGGATTARTGDPGAAYYNPAALVDGQGLRVGLGSLFAVTSATVTSSPDAPPPAYSASPASGLRGIPYVAASYAADWWAAGVSVNVPFGGGIKWPRDWPLRFEARESSTVVLRVSPFFGARWRWLSFAAGPYVDRITTELTRSTNHVTSEGEFRVAAGGTGVGGHASVLVKPSNDVSLGVAYKSRDFVHVSGDVDFDVPTTFEPQFPDQHVSAKLKLPDRVAVGLGWSVAPTARVYLDGVYTFWSLNDKLDLDFERAETPDATIRYAFRDTFALRAGGELDVSPSVTLRLGVFGDGLPEPAAPSNYLGPSTADMTRIGGSVGAGVKLSEWLAIDAFYQYFQLLSRTSTSADLPLATYEGSSHVFGLGARVAWSPNGAADGPRD